MTQSSLVVLSLDSYGDVTLREPLFRSLLDAGFDVTAVVREPVDRLRRFLDPRLRFETTELNPYRPPDAAFWGAARSLVERVARRGPVRVISALYARTVLDQWLLRRLGVPSVGFANPAVSDRDLDLRAEEPAVFETPGLTEAVSVPPDAPEIDKNRALVEAMGIAPVEPFRPILRVGAEEEERAREVLARLRLEPGAYALASPAGAANNPLKAWPKETFAPTVDHLRRRHGLAMLLTGVEAERADLEQLQAGDAPECALWTGGPDDLGTLLGLILMSRVYVGVDTGPMHFAAALDRPVLALFGGGHWARFLPAARRSAIVTRELPCFGCDWDCFLPEPACVTTVGADALVEAADWLLAGDEPGQTIHTGSPLPAEADGLIAGAARGHRRQLGQRREAERDREILWKRVQVSEAAQAHIHQRMGELDRALENERAVHLAAMQGLEGHVRIMQQEIVRLHAPKAAVRVLTATVLRKAGVLDAVQRRVARWKGSGGAGPQAVAGPASGARGAERSSLLDAFVLGRSLGGDVADLALERLYQLGRAGGRVACLQSTPPSAQAAVLLAAGGAEVTWLAPASTIHADWPPGITAAGGDLGHWLVASGRSTVPDTDRVVLDASVEPSTLALLNGRLPEGTSVLLLGADERWRHLLGTPDESAHGLHEYRRAPAAWRDPSAGNARYHDQRPWSSAPRRITLPDRLPSGRPWPRISVVTPTFNQAAFLEQTMLSVLRQDYPDLEYIVVDGGSEDGTQAILDRHRSALAHCIVEKDEGQADALNKGFRRATGDILAWLNSDDRYPAGALWRAALAFDAFGANMVAGGCRLVQDGSDEPVRTHRSALPVGRVVPLPVDRILDLDGSWLKGDFFFQPEVFWTRALWEKAGGRVATELYYSMDYELWVRMARAGARVVHVPDLLAVYRMHGAQKTAGEHLPYLPELRRVAARLRQEETVER